MADTVKGVEIDPVREKLVELMFVGQVLADAECDKQAECNKCPYSAPNACRVGFVADHLIANGVRLEEKQATSNASEQFASDNHVGGKWIPVTERLPEHTVGHVLVTDGNRVKISCRNALYKTANGEVRCAQGYGSGMPVTHWMPLPEPPKGE